MEVKDGTAKFRVRDQRLKAMVDFFFPVGAIYTCVTKPPWMDEYGEWKEVGAGRVLWGADKNHEAGTEMEAGLPNITGWLSLLGNGIVAPVDGKLFSYDKSAGNLEHNCANLGNQCNKFNFNASKSNPIYGASDTVQPPAYVVHFYQRIS